MRIFLVICLLFIPACSASKVDPRVVEAFGKVDKNMIVLANAIDSHTKRIKELEGKKK